MTTLYLFAILLNIHTGAEVSRIIEEGPFDTIPACTEAQVKTMPTKPEGDTIVVHECAVSHVDIHS